MAKRKSKVLFVTGAASGIGAAIARIAAARGHRVVLADINFAGARAIATEIGEAAFAVELDISHPRQWARAFDLAWSEFGRVDVLINNAAVVHVGRAENVSIRQHQQTLDVNLMGPLTGMLEILPRFRAQGSGQFVTVCSMTAFLPFPGLASYAAAKHGLRAFHHAFAIEQGDSPFAFTIVHPTATETPMLEKEAASDEAPLCFIGDAVTPDHVATVVLDAMERKVVEVFMPPERARSVRMLGTNPHRLKAMVRQAEAVGAERLNQRRKLKAPA